MRNAGRRKYVPSRISSTYCAGFLVGDRARCRGQIRHADEVGTLVSGTRPPTGRSLVDYQSRCVQSRRVLMSERGEDENWK